MTGTGGATGGAVGTLEHSMAEWPMPNGPKDVANGAPNPASYTSNGDGTVTDNVTGLMWEQPPVQSLNPVDARNYCDALALAGHDDWRLPSRIELVSIQEIGSYNPAIDSVAFPGTLNPGYFISSTPYQLSANDVWSVNFYAGQALALNLTNQAAVRCVRTHSTAGTPPSSRYTDNGNGTVTDNRTGLTWQQTPTTNNYAWADIKAQCAGAGGTLGGNGWRVPTFKELQTLLDYSRYNPSLDVVAFPNVLSGQASFWSASPYAGPNTPPVGWTISFYDGSTYNPDFATSQYHLRCVR